jgi:O-methyltransferase
MKIFKSVFKHLAKTLSSKNLYLVKSLSYRKKQQALSINFDYFRYSVLGLCYEEIIKHEVKGNVAELGVYKGDFAKRLNALFPDRKLYLFDTFEGFNKNDLQIEFQSGYSINNQNFSDTSVKKVIDQMPYPQNCIIKKGVFPESALDMEDRFCFISIDADLYEPIYQGLIYFYPRLERGGYIFVHDFGNDIYIGARKAVLRFCTEHKISYVPISDNGGTAIIAK